MSDKSIAVIGGGIGGVSAALNLLRAGFDVHVYEQSRALREVGAGINMNPNAVRVIHTRMSAQCPLSRARRTFGGQW